MKFGPTFAVMPGQGGLPVGFSGFGGAPSMSNPVSEYESPLPHGQLV